MVANVSVEKPSGYCRAGYNGPKPTELRRSAFMNGLGMVSLGESGEARGTSLGSSRTVVMALTPRRENLVEVHGPANILIDLALELVSCIDDKCSRGVRNGSRTPSTLTTSLTTPRTGFGDFLAEHRQL